MGPRHVLWINGCTSRDNELISKIRNIVPELMIITSSTSRQEAFNILADQCYVEPIAISDVDYLKWADEFIARYNVDYVLPTNHISGFVKLKSMFAHQGITVLCDDLDLHDQGKLYQMLHEAGYKNIPNWKTVPDTDCLETVLEEVSEQFIKPLAARFNDYEIDGPVYRVGPYKYTYKDLFNQSVNPKIGFSDHADMVRDAEEHNCGYKMLYTEWLEGQNVVAYCYRRGEMWDIQLVVWSDEHAEYERLSNQFILQNARKVCNILNPEFGITLKYKYVKNSKTLTLVNVKHGLTWGHSPYMATTIGDMIWNAIHGKIENEKHLDTTSVF